MYFSDSKLVQITESLIPFCDIETSPFCSTSQIKQCSIDIRLSKVFWRMKRSTTPINLGASLVFEISPRRLWKRFEVEEGGALKIRPGEMILGRTAERIEMPVNCVGRITVRSSFARIGIWTALNCDIVNPGYCGHVPLELINTSPNIILIPPGMAICQLFVMSVDGPITSSYAEASGKYSDDDGGPSVWWRDELLKRMKATYGARLTDSAVGTLREKFEKIDDDGLYRLEKLIHSRPFSGANEILEAFSEHEKRAARSYRIRRILGLWGSPALAVPSLIQIQSKVSAGATFDLVSILIWSAFIVSLFPFIYFATRESLKFYE